MKRAHCAHLFFAAFALIAAVALPGASLAQPAAPGQGEALLKALVEQAKKDLRDAVNHEIQFQKARGLASIVKRLMSLPDGQEITFDLFYDAGMFYIGDPDTVAEKLKGFWDEVGGFGTLMYVAGKGWADRERRHRSMKLFMDEVAPKVRHLDADARLRQAAAE